MTDRQLIEIAAKELASRHGFTDIQTMRQRDFEYCCTRIEERSGILISLSTIKRIMHGQYNRLPQVATLNAIAVYLGYTDWQDFKAGRQRGDEGRARRRLPYPVIAAGALLLLLAALLSWNYFSSSPAVQNNAAVFTVRKTTQNAIPNTVVFNYDIDRLSGDSFFIQQSWDRHRRVRVYKGSHTLTDIYYEPGYHTAKLIAGDQVIKTMGVSIPTDAWFFYSKESLNSGLPSYIHAAHPVRKDIVGLERQDLLDNHIDPDKPQIYLYTYFPTAIRVDADNFRLRARVKMTEVRNTACPLIMPEVFCQHGFQYFVATLPGCTGGISCQFGDHRLDGKDNDLSSLACDVHAWHAIEMLVRQKRVSVFVDGKEVLHEGYSASAGLITGLGFHSNGLCHVDSLTLTGLDGQAVYP
jgi:hypothetical protein